MAITPAGGQRIVGLALEHCSALDSEFDRSFQALQQKAAECVAIERARALSYFSALTITTDDPRRRLACMMAKAAAGEAQ